MLEARRYSFIRSSPKPRWGGWIITGTSRSCTNSQNGRELADGALGLLDEGRASARQDRGEAIERANVFLLNLGGVIAPPLHRRQFFVFGFPAQVMRGVGYDADIDAVLVMGVEEILEHHGAAAFSPFRPALPISGAEIVRRLFRSIDV
jgi:hypothetical protein